MIKNKIFYRILWILQIILFFSLYYWNQMKTEKMGVVRHITYWNTYKFSRIFTDSIIVFLAILLVLLVIIQLLKFKRVVLLLKLEMLFGSFVTFAGVYYINKFSVDDEFIFYYIVIFLILFTIIQFLKMLTYNLTYNK